MFQYVNKIITKLCGKYLPNLTPTLTETLKSLLDIIFPYFYYKLILKHYHLYIY